MNILEMDLGPLAPEYPVEIIVGVILVSVSYTHLTLPTNREV